MDSGDGALRQRAIVNTVEHDVVALALKAFHGVADRPEVGWSGTRPPSNPSAAAARAPAAPVAIASLPIRVLSANSNVSALLETERLAPN